MKGITRESVPFNMVPTGWEIGKTESITDLAHKQHAGRKEMQKKMNRRYNAVPMTGGGRCREQETTAAVQIA